MITVISGTNREDNNTKKVAIEYQRLLQEKSVDSCLFALDEINGAIKNEAFVKAETELLQASEQFIIVMPEYNGSYPGILKLMIDNTDVDKTWWHKKVLLTGVSTGRAGNLRGMEHLTGCLLHMKMRVHPNRLPISLVHKLMDANGKFTDINTLAAIDTQLEEFLDF
ncbi:MAG: NADPH-dependent oxidoreductase [Chitinophagaceae bacterium]|nr:MAG: NADPH-dependent oxidoreductase [Chitinophagaceae bacterium]